MPKKDMRRASLFLFFFLSLAPFAISQPTGDIGVFGGVGYYMGDLNPSKLFFQPKPSMGILYRYNMNHRLSVQGHYIHGTVTASDAKSKANPSRDLNFISNVDEMGVQFEVNFFEYFTGSRMHWWTPYIFGGTSVFLFKPYGDVNGKHLELQPLHTEGQNSNQYPDRTPYHLYSFSVPFGVGVKVSINKFLGIGAEWGMRKTTTDYLDDVSQTYYLNNVGRNPAQVSTAGYASDPHLTHNAGMQRGNSKNTDWYSFAGITVVVKIRMLGKERCLDHQREGH